MYIMQPKCATFVKNDQRQQSKWTFLDLHLKCWIWIRSKPVLQKEIKKKEMNTEMNTEMNSVVN